MHIISFMSTSAKQIYTAKINKAVFVIIKLDNSTWAYYFKLSQLKVRLYNCTFSKVKPFVPNIRFFSRYLELHNWSKEKRGQCTLTSAITNLCRGQVKAMRIKGKVVDRHECVNRIYCKYYVGSDNSSHHGRSSVAIWLIHYC